MITIARFADLNGDEISDVLVNGRGAPTDDRPLLALDGRTGVRLWRIQATEPAWRNVYTPQPIGDVDDDGVEDWIVSAGGDLVREPLERPSVPGKVVAVSGAGGEILGSVDLPDRQETYASPVVTGRSDGELEVVVGSGGELFPGSLWSVPVAAVLESNGSGFRELLSGDDESSFIAPASVGDLDGDGAIEIVATRSDGHITAVDPASGNAIWTAEVTAVAPGTSDALTATAMAPAIGQLDGDDPLEVVIGSYATSEDDLVASMVPRHEGSMTILDGSNGAVEARLQIDAGSSVASPLLIGGSDGTVAVLCVCSPVESEGEASAGLGLWSPGGSTVEPLGLPSSIGSTPLVVRDATGTFEVVSIGAVGDSGEASTALISSAPLKIGGGPVRSSPWAGYLGTTGDGFADLP